MPIGSKELTPVELDTYEDERLLDELKKAKEELFNLRFQSATGQLESHGRLRAVKRDIARIYTVIRERELGIRATPAPLEPAAKAKRASKKTDVAEDAPAAEDATDETAVESEPEAKAPKATKAKEAK
ncbi:MAG TPA: 50S ribosomal protein L29 [Galbitalea sp.]|jgi:large subunit ribosomal protein L29|nr:50S ribosomal protein L29 [Galbitalea sp.]